MRRILFAVAGVAPVLALLGVAPGLAIAPILRAGLVHHAVTGASAIADVIAVEREEHPQSGHLDPEKITVFVTRTGAKYHRDGCRYLSRSKIAMPLKEAAKKYDACKVCRPPDLPVR